MQFPLSMLLLIASSTAIDNTMDSVSVFSKLIHEYGPFVVILAVMLVLLVVLVIILVKGNDKMVRQSVSSYANTDDFIKTISSKILDSFLKTVNGSSDNGEESYHENLVSSYMNVNSQLSDASKAASKSLSCSRIAIYVFHNGNKSLFGLPFFKVSCIHECTNNDSGTIRGKSHVDMPLHLFNDFIEPLWKFGFYRSENVNITVQRDRSLREFVSYSDTKAIYFVSIKNSNNVTTGFISAEFDNVDTFETNENRDIEVKSVLDYMSIQIAPMINSYNNYRNNTDGQ